MGIRNGNGRLGKKWVENEGNGGDESSAGVMGEEGLVGDDVDEDTT